MAVDVEVARRLFTVAVAPLAFPDASFAVTDVFA
jgi:hypothetical protein